MILERVNLSPGNFAEQIGVAPATISHILSGRNKYPSAEVMLRLHEAYPEIDLNWLLTGEGMMKKDDPDSLFTGTLFGEPTLNAAKTSINAATSTEKPENRKEIQSDIPLNTDNTVVKQEIIYKEKPSRKIAEIRIFYDDGTYETFTPNK